jgi:hypothetical protein
MTTVMLNIEYKMYPDFIVSIRRFSFFVVTFIGEGLIVPNLLDIDSGSILELGVSILIINLYCLFVGSWISNRFLNGGATLNDMGWLDGLSD